MKRRFAKLVEVLSEGMALIASVGEEDYVYGADDPGGGSVGQHLRHVLDHFRSVLEGLQAGRVDYEIRVRGTCVEVDRDEAVAQAARLCDQLHRLVHIPPSRLISVRCFDESRQDFLWCKSSILRELEYLHSHTIHHYAIIAALCRVRGVQVPRDFGVAPSTLRYRQINDDATSFREQRSAVSSTTNR